MTNACYLATRGVDIGWILDYSRGPSFDEIGTMVKEVAELWIIEHKRAIDAQMVAIGSLFSPDRDLHKEYCRGLDAAWSEALQGAEEPVASPVDGETPEQAADRERKMRKMLQQLDKLRKPIWTGTHWAKPFMA